MNFTSFSENILFPANNAGPDEMFHCVPFHLGHHCLLKYSGIISKFYLKKSFINYIDA